MGNEKRIQEWGKFPLKEMRVYFFVKAVKAL